MTVGRVPSLVLASLGIGLAIVPGCGDPRALPCEELSGAAEPLPRVELSLGDVEISAELADTASARSTAWAGRRCDLDGLLWVPDAIEPPSITLCEVEVAVDLVSVLDGEVIAVQLDRAPCEGPCDACPTVDGGGLAVQAVLWLVAGQMEVAIGDPIDGLGAVALPGAS